MCFLCTEPSGFETDIATIVGISKTPAIETNELISPPSTPQASSIASNENKYTFNIVGLNQTSPIYDGIQLNSIKGIEYLSSKFKWKGTLDFVVNFVEEFWWAPDGTQGFGGYGNVDLTHTEITTGIDKDTTNYDLGSWVKGSANAEKLYNYGSEVFIDPNPIAELDSSIPAGTHDYFSIFIHESLHTFGFTNNGTAHKNLLFTNSGEPYDPLKSTSEQWYFTGESAVSMYGQNIELAPNAPWHYSLTSEYDIMGGPGGYGLYEQNRWTITKLDQAIFGDLGLGIVLDGDNTNENYIGGLGDDIINTFGGDDVIKGRSGDDQINGGEGSDKFILLGDFSNYSFTRATNSLVITDQRTGTNDGTDTLKNIECIQFSDQTVEESKVDIVKTYSGNFSDYKFYNKGNGVYQIKTGSGYDDITGLPLLTFTGEAATSSFRDVSAIVDIKGTFDQVTGLNTQDAKMFRLYNAAFKRLPDADGLKYWIGKYTSGENDDRAVAQSFLVSAEFKERYGDNVSNAKYVETLYLNVLGRDYDQEGYNYWLGNLNSGLETRYELLLGFAESPENKGLFTDMTGFS